MTNFNARFPSVAAAVLFASCIIGALTLHIVPALLAGLLSFVLTQGLLAALRQWDTNRRLLAHELLAGVIIGIGSLAVLAGISILVARFLAGESLREFMLTVSETLEQAKQFLPPVLAGCIPDSLLELRAMAANALKEHANLVAGVGTHILHGLLLTLIGWITGVLAAVGLSAPAVNLKDEPAFGVTWHRLWAQLSIAFKSVALAQAKIAGLNAMVTGAFLLVVMPLLGWHLPYAKTLILATFLCGLVPVVGNLVSNSLLCTLALSIAFPAAVASLVFLVVIHKLEYFLNARIQGHKIGAKAWELLIVLFTFELLFGPAGMVAAPVIYAFVKADLKRMHWIV